MKIKEGMHQIYITLSFTILQNKFLIIIINF